MSRLKGKVALITGAGSGIGRATAALFTKEGAQVALLDRVGPSVHQLERELSNGDRRARAWEIDVSDSAKLEEVIAEAAREFGRLDVLVSNAATYIAKPFDALTIDEWWSVLDTNLTAYFVGARAAAREMAKVGAGSIVNICSVQRVISEPNSGAYATSKGGVAQLTRNLAIEFAASNILVNSISPGFVRTRMSIVNGVDETTTEGFRRLYVETGRIPLRRPGQPEEIAAAALFLASHECTYLTGADLIVDGGLTITV
jgi:NAD(P)-dependent dehydrogenase (short-subunit alcohol dehydrogenase family)